MRLHRHADTKERRRHLGAKEGWYRGSSGCATIATHAGISSGRVVSISTNPPDGFREPDPVVRARLLAVFELRLRHGRPEVDVPERRRFDLIGDARARADAETPAARRAARAGSMVAYVIDQSTDRPR